MTAPDTGGPILAVPGRTREAFRRSVWLCLALGLLALLAGTIFGGAAIAAFGCLGLALGAVNALLIQRDVLRQAAAVVPSKAALARGVGVRLALVTAVAVGVALVFYPSGLGTFLGLALFQVVSTIVGAIPALKELRK